MASARRVLHPVRIALGFGVVLLVVGLGMLAAEAQGRMDAVENAIEFTAEQQDSFGNEATGLINYLRMSSLTRSLLTGADVPSYEVEELDEDGGFSINEREQRVVYALEMSWHAGPTTVPAFAGLVIIVAALFVEAARWHRREVERSRN